MKKAMNSGSLYALHTLITKKAFDSVEHEVIFQAFRHIGINESYINIIEDIYTGAKARVHIEKQESEEINILGQGDLISPKLSTAAIKEVFKNSEFESRGIDIEQLNVVALGFCCATISVIQFPLALALTFTFKTKRMTVSCFVFGVQYVYHLTGKAKQEVKLFGVLGRRAEERERHPG